MACIIQIGPFPLPSNHIQGGVEASVFGLTEALGTMHEVHVLMPLVLDGVVLLKK
jgi:hypothetical protein